MFTLYQLEKLLDIYVEDCLHKKREDATAAAFHRWLGVQSLQSLEDDIASEPPEPPPERDER